MRINFLTKQNGQSLIEALVAVTILGFIIVVLVSGFKNIFQSAENSDQRLVGQQLAAEGLEIVYNISANASNWKLDFSDAFYGNVSTPSIMTEAQNGVVRTLYIDQSVSPYSLVSTSGSDNLPSGYNRIILLEPAKRALNGDLDESGYSDIETTSPDEHIRTFKATSRVTWTQNGLAQQAEFVTYLVSLN